MRRSLFRRSLFISVLLLAMPGSAETGGNTFKSSDGLFRFTYPTDYVLYTGAELEQAERLTYVPVCRRPAAACVVFPRELYAGTNFEGAALQVSTLDATNEGKCVKPLRIPDYAELRISAERPFQVIHGVRFVHSVTAEGGAGHYMDTNLYRAFHAGRCYVLAINIAQTAFANFPEGMLTEFTTEDENRVLHDLQQVLDSFQFTK